MEEKKMNITLPPEKAGGQYANLAIISHSPSEFIMDFATLLPGIQQAIVQSRIIMTPEHAKRLLHALTDKVAKYEEQFGNITEKRTNPVPGSTYPLSFGSGEA